jgi:hypothetical protein
VTANTLLSRLDKVRQTGRDAWMAACPAHADRSPSLSIRQMTDGRVLVHDFGGCDVHDVLAAAGVELSDLFPPRPDDRLRRPPERRPFPAMDALIALDDDVLLVHQCALAVARGEVLSETTIALLGEAGARIHAARNACAL